jgi:hypothetical protein
MAVAGWYKTKNVLYLILIIGHHYDSGWCAIRSRTSAKQRGEDTVNTISTVNLFYLISEDTTERGPPAARNRNTMRAGYPDCAPRRKP